MATSPETTRTTGSVLASFGRWVYRQSRYRSGSIEELGLQRRAAIVSAALLVTGLGTLGYAVTSLLMNEPVALPGREALDSTSFIAAITLGLLSVFAPQVVFRSRSDTAIRKVLADPSAPFRPWRTATVTFDAVLVGGMLAGLYFPASLTFAVLGTALVIKYVITGRRTLRRDPNARYHRLMQAWTSAAGAMTAYAIVAGLAPVLEPTQVFVPLLIAGIAAFVLFQAMGALDNWVEGSGDAFHFLQALFNPRRVAVALISALIAWFVVIVGDVVDTSTMAANDFLGTIAGVAGFLLAWLLLWLASIRLWTYEADRALTLWGDHEAEVIQRIAQGQLDPVLAARAAPITTARMAIMTFAATRAWVIAESSNSPTARHLAVADLYPNTPEPEPRSLIEGPHLTLPLYERPDEVNASRVVIADWLWPGWFLTRSTRLVRRFRQLAIESIIAPEAARDDISQASAFDSMFDTTHRWPTVSAFEQALDRMRTRADLSPTSDSVVVGVYAIDDFGALAGGKFEQAAVGQVMRMAAGYGPFAGHDVFVAYQDPGRLWVALAGGPMVRSGIELLHGLQERINDGGAIPSAHVDLDVHVGVAFGYSAHQVDDFDTEGLMRVAEERLAVDAAARNPLIGGVAGFQEITPEAIIGSAPLPTSPIDVLALLDDDRASNPEAFVRCYRPVVDVINQRSQAMLLGIGWNRTLGNTDLTTPEAFQSIVTRQIELASSSVGILSDAVHETLDNLGDVGRQDLPIVVSVPPVLLTPEAGAAALPNILVPQLDRHDLSRLVILIGTIPFGSGEALRTLHDRGVRIAVTSAAAAQALGEDQSGWRPWAIFFPASVVQHGRLDALLIHQTVSAFSGPDTHLVAEAATQVLERTNGDVTWALDPNDGYRTLAAALEGSDPVARPTVRSTSPGDEGGTTTSTTQLPTRPLD